MPGFIICLFISACCLHNDNQLAAELWGWLAAIILVSGYVFEYFSGYIYVMAV